MSMMKNKLGHKLPHVPQKTPVPVAPANQNPFSSPSPLAGEGRGPRSSRGKDEG